MNLLRSLISAVALVSLPAYGFGSSFDSIKLYEAAIDEVKSYDVTFRIGFLEFPYFSDVKNEENPSSVWYTVTNRDVFAVGLGRRNEDNIWDVERHVISVIDWDSAVASGEPLARAITKSMPGLSYHDYLDPVVGDFFMSELLRNPNTKMTALEPEPDHVNWKNFQVDLGGLRLKLWLDSDHGCLPRKIEWYQKTQDGSYLLTEKMSIEDYITIGDGFWVPAIATNERYMTTGSTVGRAFSGQKIEIDKTNSTWNSIKSKDLFLSKNLPEVNLVYNGWSSDYPASLLGDARASLGLKPIEVLPRHFGLIRVFLLVAFVVVTALLLIYLTMMKSRRVLIK